jgi:hypothetical protein
VLATDDVGDPVAAGDPDQLSHHRVVAFLAGQRSACSLRSSTRLMWLSPRDCIGCTVDTGANGELLATTLA